MLWDTSLEDVIGQLDRGFRLFDAWDLGAVAERGRFAEHRRVLAAAVGLFRGAEGDDWKRAAETFIAEKRLTPYAAALTESHELADLLRYLESNPTDVLRRKLKEILSGPQHVEDESPSSAHARNTLFELNVAARLWRSGLRPEVGGRTDIRCDFSGKTLLFECKRPFSNAGVPRAIRDARRQLQAARKTEPAGTRGVIVISLARIITAGYKYFGVSSEDSANRALKNLLEDAIAEHRRHLHQLPDYIIAAMFHVIALTEVRDQQTYITGQSTAICPLARSSSFDEQIAQQLHERLGLAAY